MKSRKKKGEKESAPDLIQMMTISLFVILLAFFILLNSIAVIDDQKKLEVMASLLGNFGVMTGGLSILEGKGGDMKLPGMESLTSHVNFSDLMVGSEEIIQLTRIMSDHRGTVLSIPARLLFERGGVDIIPSGAKILGRLCSTIQKNDYPVEICGHTDNRPPVGRKTMSNRELSAVRAMKVLNYFMKKNTFRPDRFTAYGWGQYRPIAANQTKETRELNRRVELVFVHEAPPEKPKGIFTFRKFFFKVFN